MTKTLYDPTFEHDACGVGMVADLTARPPNATIVDALTILENLEHRGATGADVDSGDGAGILIQMPDAFLRSVFGDVPRAAASTAWRTGWCPSDGDLDVGARDDRRRARRASDWSSVGWRDVPVDSSLLGRDVAARPNRSSSSN